MANSRYDEDHSLLTGNDASLETSLKEYGLAWIENKVTSKVLFYYGIRMDKEEYVRFDFSELDLDVNVETEWNWACGQGETPFAELMSFVGMTYAEWSKGSITQKVTDLLSYYGFENVFGSSYWEGLTYLAIFKDLPLSNGYFKTGIDPFWWSDENNTEKE